MLGMREYNVAFCLIVAINLPPVPLKKKGGCGFKCFVKTVEFEIICLKF